LVSIQFKVTSDIHAGFWIVLWMGWEEGDGGTETEGSGGVGGEEGGEELYMIINWTKMA